MVVIVLQSSRCSSESLRITSPTFVFLLGQRQGNNIAFSISFSAKAVFDERFIIIANEVYQFQRLRRQGHNLPLLLRFFQQERIYPNGNQALAAVKP